MIIILQGVPQPLGRSYSFVQQQKQQQKMQQQQQQQVRRRERDDDAMHERYLMISQTHEQSRQRLSSNTSSSNSSNSSSNSAAGEETEGHAEGDDSKKKRSNGNPSPPPSPFYGNLLADADHLLPLQHYILQQAKLSGNKPRMFPTFQLYGKTGFTVFLVLFATHRLLQVWGPFTSGRRRRFFGRGRW